MRETLDRKSARTTAVRIKTERERLRKNPKHNELRIAVKIKQEVWQKEGRKDWRARSNYNEAFFMGKEPSLQLCHTFAKQLLSLTSQSTVTGKRFLTLARSPAKQCTGLLSVPYSVLINKKFKCFLLIHRGRTVLVITTKSSRTPDLQQYWPHLGWCNSRKRIQGSTQGQNQIPTMNRNYRGAFWYLIALLNALSIAAH